MPKKRGKRKEERKKDLWQYPYGSKRICWLGPMRKSDGASFTPFLFSLFSFLFLSPNPSPLFPRPGPSGPIGLERFRDDMV